ncbi:MAG: PEP-CTERM sorting domain-containing protein [Burkholderiales bacterium]|nr:PEP-CTERM sorting domain-containing protein [Burkholderiales bacterium]
MNTVLRSRLAAAFVLGCASLSLQAAPTVTVGGAALSGAGLKSSVPGIFCPLISFDSGSAGSECTGVTYSPATGNNYVTGLLPGVSAPPPDDTTQYLTISPARGSTVTVTLNPGANYFGFYAGSLDPFNSIRFNYSDLDYVVYTGTQLAAFAGIPADGNQAVGRYFNIYSESGRTFSSVVLSSSDVAFETDNHAFGVASVPAPGALALLGIGALGLFGAARRRVA